MALVLRSPHDPGPAPSALCQECFGVAALATQKVVVVLAAAMAVRLYVANTAVVVEPHDMPFPDRLTQDGVHCTVTGWRNIGEPFVSNNSFVWNDSR